MIRRTRSVWAGLAAVRCLAWRRLPGWPRAYTADVAADISATILTVVCAAIAGSCGLLVLRLWRAGSRTPE